MKIDLLIFDCDGVLIDSEIIAHRVATKEMTRIGFPLTIEKSIKLFSGIANEDLAGVIQEEYGKAMSNNELEMIIKKIEDSFQTELKPVSNISQVIDYLDQKHMDKCIASNSMYDYVTTALTLTGMDSCFSNDRIFSASMVKKGKPMPDLFLHVADQLQVNPTNCIVIEDSVVGIKAAKAANMSVIGFLGGSHTKNAWYCDCITKMKPWLVANDAIELLDILRGQKNSRV